MAYDTLECTIRELAKQLGDSIVEAHISLIGGLKGTEDILRKKRVTLTHIFQ
jgi:hypothetical protein